MAKIYIITQGLTRRDMYVNENEINMLRLVQTRTHTTWLGNA